MNSNKIISSVYESWVTNPFRDDYNYIRDLVHFDFIYLQNGMISDGLIPSALIKNFGLFITSSKKEFNCIISSSYRFNKIKNVVLTGFPRFDHLEELTKSIKKERLILLIPAWRKFIRGTIDLVTHQAIYSDNFKNSTFFNFYNDFINDQRLITIFKKFNFTGIFCLHPSYSRQYSDFTQNNYFLVKENCNYQEYLAKSSLLITDYSNLFLDFAYIKRPIIYIQFDIKEYKTYNPNRYFNYEKDGFGPICTNINCVINEIIKEIENDCKIMNRYMRNINKYFAFSDKKNNDRIYLELTKKLNHYYSKSTKMIIYFFITFSSMFIKLKKNYINNLIKSIFF